MKKWMLVLLPALFSISFLNACTFGYNIKNKALVLSAEAFDQDVEKRGKDAFTEAEQQKAYAELLRKNSRLELKSFSLKGDNEATGELEIETVPRSLDADFAKTPRKDWATKFKSSVQSKTYTLQLKKTDTWQLSPLTF
jgi:hypothetical protein